ncbi:MAG: HNH endonuclease [Saprospiraceae bacterium]|jgi:5-methylcytosine-specific restriction protein A|nr:HNH endonuclease [Saprospiraceae bacterium]
MMTTASHLTKDFFVEILQDKDLAQQEDLLIFQTIYALEKQEASATDLARLIGWTDKGAVVGRLVGLGKRILKKYDIQQRERADGSKTFWDFFFSGYYRGTFFIYQLKPELKEALEECGLTNTIKPISLQNAYLFVWNPSKWSQWTDPSNEPYIEKNIEELKNTGKVTLIWSCRSHKRIRPGDRAFLAKVGSSHRGIFGSGKVVSEPFISQHWSGEDKDVPRVLIEFDVLLNPEKDPILTIDKLDKGNLAKQQWTPQSSGISIRHEALNELEEEWFEFLRVQEIRCNPFFETADTTQTYVEGAATQITQTRYERNVFARNECLKHYGYSCSVCDFNFERFYGSLGYKFIHVHHLIKVATIKQEYKVDPILDLRPVCPNCHSMLHKQDPPLTIEELKEMIKNK